MKRHPSRGDKRAIANPRSTAVEHEIVRRVEGLFALADQLEARVPEARGQLDQLTPALSLHEILFTRSQRVQISDQFVSQDPNDEPQRNC